MKTNVKHRLADLCVSDDGDPIGLGWSWHGEQSPEEYAEGVRKSKDAGIHKDVQDHRKVTKEIRSREQHFNESVHQLQEARHSTLELLLCVFHGVNVLFLSAVE